MRLLLALMLTLLQYKSGRCDTACGYLGYMGGSYDEKSDTCLCYDQKPYEETVTKKRTLLPSKPVPHKENTTPLYW